MSSQVYEAACKLLDSKHSVNRHSMYQLKYFVLGKEQTTQAKLRKCLNELAARRETIEHLRLSIADMEDDVLLLSIKIKKLEEKQGQNDLHKQWQQIQTRKLERRQNHAKLTIKGLNKKLKEAEEEAAFFVHAYYQLEKVEPLKSFDDPIKESNYWNEKFAEELKLRVLLQKPLEAELVKSILAMDKDAPIRAEMIHILEQLERQVSNPKNQMDRAIEVAKEAGNNQQNEWPKENTV